MTDDAVPPVRRATGLRPVIAASVVATAGVLPVFLMGAVAVLVRAELGFTEARLGLAVSAFFGLAALASIPSGFIVERLGDQWSLILGSVGSGVALIGMATAWAWLPLFLWLGAAGLANSVSQLAANSRLAGGVPPDRQGLAFGIKQSANPLATLVGGLAVPLIALTLGWRWVFVFGAVISLTAGVTMSQRRVARRPASAKRREPITIARRPLVILSIAVTFGAAAVTAMAAFVVEYAVHVGIEPGPAGFILALGSVIGVSARVGAGWLADRLGRGSLKMVIVMVGSGVVAFAAFPLVDTLVPLAIVTVLAYVVAWGWPGLFNLAIIRGNRHAPAAATGITQVGAYAGGVSGPFLFGLLVSQYGYSVAWWTASGWLLVAAILMFVGRVTARRIWLQPVGDQTGPATAS